ncbi:MAG: TOPRIM nucleotidyl transferase/hydrolase domain-containing protein [Solirubrobacteraceae bacterium]
MIDPDAINPSVLDCGGRENLPDYVRLLDKLHIDAFVITDGDASKIKDNDSTAKNVAAVEAAATGRMFRFAEVIETALGTQERGRARRVGRSSWRQLKLPASLRLLACEPNPQPGADARLASVDCPFRPGGFAATERLQPRCCDILGCRVMEESAWRPDKVRPA